ncbi:DUF87 domain-containing protein [Listeria booriae]|uniref:VirB4 family type IV secretion system protein n=1 Tax=Listeria booriae TaxID=1552123 RepID=UPI00162AD048|nr:DUF87 domain-containing protein [Listeria booriae]MBC1920468.1 DUF87 domain-containing protein [Listeria booriae]
MLKAKKKQKKTFQGFTYNDQLAPVIFREEEDYVKVGDEFERTVMVITYPEGGKLGWMRDVYAIDGNISTTFLSVPIPTEQAEKDLSSSIKNIKVKLRMSNLKENERQRLEIRLDQTKNALRRIVGNENGGFFEVNLAFKIHAITLTELDKLTVRVKRKLSSKGVTAYIAQGAMKDAFLSHLPTVDSKIERYTARPMDAEALATMFPMDSSDLDVKTGFVVGVNPKTKQLISMDLRSLPNHNGILFGESGYGKTVTMFEIQSRLWMSGARVITVDPEGEYVAPTKKMGGTVIDVSNGSKDVINPLEVFYENTVNASDDDEEAPDIFLEHLENKKIFFKLLRPQNDEDVLAELDDVLIELYKRFNINGETDFSKLKPEDYPILEDYYVLMEEMKTEESSEGYHKFLKVLKQYVYGSNKRIFNGHTNVNLDNNLIVFNIKKLGSGSAMQTCAMHNTIQYIWNLITNNVRETYIFFDEMHVLNNPDTPQAMKLIYQIYKRIRKYGDSGAWSATQQTSDALSLSVGGMNYGAAVVENSRVKIFLPLSSRSIQVLKDEADITFSEEELRIMTPRENNVGQALMNYSNKKVHVNFQPTSVEWALLGKNPKKIA